ncbi:MAG: LamG-like jellyroll fold domain-containing protein [Luteibaculaceae bacterium]
MNQVLFSLSLFTLIYLFPLALMAQFAGSGNAFDFQDGRAILPPANGLQPSSTFDQITFETWVFWRGLTGNNPSGLLEGRNTQAAANSIHFEITTNGGSLRIRVGGVDFTIQNAVFQNIWTHLAFTANRTTNQVNVYRNGILIGSSNNTVINQGNGGAGPSFNHYFRIGTSCCGDIATPNASRPFNGIIDEVKLWYKEKTAIEIQSGMTSKELPGTPDLIIYYDFDNIVNNLAIDFSGNENHAQLIGNFTQQNLVTSGAPVGNDNTTVFAAPNEWNSITINKGRITIKDITATIAPDGISIYEVNSLPNTLNGITNLPDEIDFYHGVHVIGGSNVSYTLVVDFNDLVVSRNSLEPLSIRLYDRENPNATLWSPFTQESNIDTDENEIRVDNATGPREFIISGNPSLLPVTLLNFQGASNGIENLINWTTAAEINNFGFSLQRSVNGFDFQEIAWIPGQGTSNNLIRYSFTDRIAANQTYYKLIQQDFDGTEEIFGPILIEKNSVKQQLLIAPNPVTHDKIFISNITAVATEINIIDLTGNRIYHHILPKMESQDYMLSNLNLRPGMYILQILGQSEMQQKKFIVK